jgi:mycothiol synthase
MTEQDDLVFRPPTPADAPVVTRLVNDSLLHEIGMADLDPHELEKRWRQSGSLDHLAVAQTHAGEIVGYLATEVDAGSAHIYFEGCTAERALGRGIGTALIKETQARAEALASQLKKPVTLETDVNGQAACDLLAAQGFQVTGRNFAMFMDLDDDLPPPEWPQGIAPRPYVVGVDDREFFDVIVRGFEMDPAITAESWLNRKTLPDFSPDLWWFAQSDHDAVAAIECRDHWHAQSDTGWVKNIAVLAGWRRMGIGRALLLHAFARFRLEGRSRVVLGVDADNPTHAREFYESIGMYTGAEGSDHRKIIEGR